MPQADLQKIVELSRHYGADPEYVVAGGGNTSVKIGDTLYVKPSGVSLATIRAEDFVPMDRERIRHSLDQKYSADPTEREAQAKARLMAAKSDPGSPARPSVETPMHEALDYTFVVHTHPNRINGLTCAKGGPAQAAELFPEDTLWIDYVDPGHTLALKIHTELSAYKKKNGTHPHVVLMQNHGILVGGDTSQEVIDITDRIIQKLPASPTAAAGASGLLSDEELDELLPGLMPSLRKLLSVAERRLVRLDQSAEVTALLADPKGRDLTSGGTFTPDHIVYCKEKAAWAPFDPKDPIAALERTLAAFRTTEDYVPKIVLMERVGMFASDTTTASTDNAAAVYRDWIRVARNTASYGGPRFLSKQNVTFIDNWEVEAYRRRKAKEAPTADRYNQLGLDPAWARELADRVVLITGGGSGVGRAIAQACAFMGASPVLVDSNKVALDAATEELRTQYGTASALSCTGDVTDESSICAAFGRAVRQFGGVDAVVNVPSIAPGGALDEIDIPAYEKALKINLLGYAIVGKYAAKVMKQQGWGVGLNITSKSGLFPSAENNAYATTKSGEINQGYSFAAELGAHGIRWNNLAMGNIFELSSNIWSDAYFKERADKKGIDYGDSEDCRRKVIAYYNSLNALNTDIKPADIAYAVGFLLSDKSRAMSGHTMLVDGGQTYH